MRRAAARAAILSACCADLAAAFSKECTLAAHDTPENVRRRARTEWNFTEAQAEDFVVRPPHFDHHGLYEVTLADGNIIIADPYRHELRETDPGSIEVRRIGQNGTSPGQFRYPRGLAEGRVNRTRIEVDGSPHVYEVKTLYVADYGNSRVQMLDLEAGSYMKAYGTLGPGDYELDHPENVYMHEGRLYVVDRGNHRIVVLDNELNFLFEFGSFGLGNGQLDHPAHVSVYCPGGHKRLCRIWVSDRDAYVRFQNFDMNGKWLETMRSSGGPAEEARYLGEPV